MKELTFSNGLLRNRGDLARCFGLPPKARARDISSAFGKATRYDAWLHIEEVPEIARSPETWEIRIIKSSAQSRLELRKDGRGEWARQAENIPQDVLEFFSTREARDGGMITTRSWEAWARGRWLKGRGRRLRGKNGEIHAIVEVPDVRRETGRIQEFIVIEPLCAKEDLAPSRRLPLPLRPREIMQVVGEFREAALPRAA